LQLVDDPILMPLGQSRLFSVANFSGRQVV